jgi:stage III sporulation protein AD
MDIMKIVFFALVCVILIVILKNNRPEYALMVQIGGGVIIALFIVTKLMLMIGVLQDISNKIRFDGIYFKILLKVVGITYVAEFAMGICKDADQSAIAGKVELAAKVMILIVSLPVIYTLLDKIELLLD